VYYQRRTGRNRVPQNETEYINNYRSDRVPGLTGLQASLGWNSEASTESQTTPALDKKASEKPQKIPK
jgi:hypothetical protein